MKSPIHFEECTSKEDPLGSGLPFLFSFCATAYTSLTFSSLLLLTEGGGGGNGQAYGSIFDVEITINESSRFTGKSVCDEVFVMKIEILVADIPSFTAFSRGEGNSRKLT